MSKEDLLQKEVKDDETAAAHDAGSTKQFKR